MGIATILGAACFAIGALALAVVIGRRKYRSGMGWRVLVGALAGLAILGPALVLSRAGSVSSARIASQAAGTQLSTKVVTPAPQGNHAPVVPTSAPKSGPQTAPTPTPQGNHAPVTSTSTSTSSGPVSAPTPTPQGNHAPASEAASQSSDPVVVATPLPVPSQTAQTRQGAPATSVPGGLWVAPANNATVGDNVTIKAQAYPTNYGDPAIWYVNFTGWYNGQWNVICRVYSPSYSNVYECPWHLAGLIQPGWVTISFDVYNTANQANYAPNGMHSIYYSPPPPGGLWVAPANNSTVNDTVTIKAQAYPTNAGDPAISHVNFTGWYNGRWNVMCSVYAPSYSNVYQCSWKLAGVIQPGWVTISFDVYDVIGHANYAPNGTHSIYYSPSPPGGLWVTPANNATVGDTLTIKAQAYPTNAGDPAISHVNFTGWYNGKWNVICSVYAPSYSNVYQCFWTLRGLISPGWVTISFDVYDVIGHVNYAPNGMHSIYYSPPPPGGLWVAPANNATVGDNVTIQAKAYPTNSGDPAISHVNFTGWYNGKWNVMCSAYTPSYSNVYQCQWKLAGIVQPGWVTISFDVYDVIGHVNYAPNGTHNINYSPPPPKGLWVAPASGAQVGDGAVLEATVTPANTGDPAIDHVHFTAYYGGAWHILCSVHAPTFGNIYECGWMLKGVISPGAAVTISFDVYDVIGHYRLAPGGWRSITYVPGAAKPMTAIAWAMTKLGSQSWNGLCETFVENAYGTQYKYLTAQRAYDALHTSTTWTPDIGALVWFVPNSSNGGAGHVGIYIGNGQFISATYNGVKVQYMNWWSDHVATYEGWGNAPTSWPGQ